MFLREKLIKNMINNCKIDLKRMKKQYTIYKYVIHIYVKTK